MRPALLYGLSDCATRGWHACPRGGVVVVRTRTASAPPVSRPPRPAPLRRRGLRGAASAATAWGRRGSAKHFRPARPPPLLRQQRLGRGPGGGGAGPGGGRRRPPRPAPLARRAPAPASPPVADELPPVLHPPRRRRPRRLPKGLGARLGARGSGLGSRENSPPVPRPCALRTCTHGPSSAAPAPAPPSSAARRHRLRTGGGRHPSPRGGARGGRRLDFTGPRSRTARRRGPPGAGSYAGPLA